MSARTHVHPPRAAELLVTFAAPPAEAGWVAGDMREEFDNVVAAAGAGAARRWYWSETMRSILPLVVRRWRAARRASHTPRTGDSTLTPILGDARYALRLSARRPLASFAIVATMVLGIGATTAVFSAMNAILLRPLPFPESQRVVQLNGVLRSSQTVDYLAYPDLMDFRRSVPGIGDLTVYSTNVQTLQHGTDPQIVHTVQVDETYPRVFGVHAAFGRLFAPSDLVVNAPKVAVLSHRFWMREFGGDLGIVGRTITLDDESVLVVGVLADGAYTHPQPSADALTPLVIVPNTPMTNRGSMWAGASARLKPGASIEQVRRDLASVASLIATQFPPSNSGITATALPVHDAVVGSVQSMLQLLAAAVAAVLLIACINIANLILGRAQTRSREFAVRSALGGSPARVRRQILTESLVLALFGGALGVALAPLLTHALVAVYPDSLPRAEEIGVDARVLLVAAVATVLAGVLSALPTARRAGRLDLVQDLRDGGRAGSGRQDRRMGRVLIITQVAASLALLFAAGLLMQTFWRLTQLSPGFDARGTTTFHVYASRARYKTGGDVTRYYDAVTRALEAIPGVHAVGSGTFLPFGGGRRSDVWIQEERGDLGVRNPASAIAFSSVGFERTLGIPLLRGRGFTTADDTGSARVVMIDETVAKRDYAGVDPVGRTINWNGQSGWRIVGVVGRARFINLWEGPMPVLYVPARQAPVRARYFAVRSDLPEAQILAAARAALRGIDATIAFTDASTMEQRIQSSLGAQRFRAALMGTLGVLALVLAVIGIYGVVAYSVTRRMREIGIRMALGEATHDVRRRVVGDALRVAGIGIAAGVVLALAAGKWLAVFLISVSPYDVRLLGAAAALLAAVVIAAAYGPARRAARVDPVTALRGE